MKNNNCWYNEVCQLECTSSCLRYQEMKYLMDNSNIPLTKQNPKALILTPDDLDYDAYCSLADIKDDIKGFVISGNNLYITSEYTGNGKTTWAIKLLLKYFNEIWAGNGFICRGVFVHVPTFLSRLKEFNKHDELFEELKKNILECDLVIWDDIAGSGLSEYDHSQLLSYVDQRILMEKSNIYTGNICKFNELQIAVGNRLASRIYNGSTVIKFKGKDRR